MTDIKDQMARKVQAMARGYIVRKTGLGKKVRKGRGKRKGGKRAKKSKNMQAMIIQAAFRKYKARKK